MADKTEVKFVFNAADADRTIDWPCAIRVPMDGGGVEERVLMARFKVLDRDRQRALTDPLRFADADSPDAGDPNLALLNGALVTLVDVPQEGGGTIDGGTAMRELLKRDYVVIGLSRGYFQMAQGRPAKNS